MTRKSAPLKLFAALSAMFLAVSSWAAGTSDVSEGETSKVFCLKHMDIADNPLVELSQQPLGYTPADDEKCFEKWYSVDGNPSVYSELETLAHSGTPIQTIMLTTDIDLGGYDYATGQCNEEFAPFAFEPDEPATLISEDTASVRTIRGLCYKAGADEASFGGDFIGAVVGVNFETIRLESLVNAGLLGSSMSAPVFLNVSIDNAFVKAPIAGVLTSSTEEMTVTNFIGTNLYVSSLPELDDSEPFMTPRMVAIGGLVGLVQELNVVKANFKTVTVTNNPETSAETMTTISQEINDVEAYLGGIVGVVGSVMLENVGIEEIQVIDRSDNEKTSDIGGLIGRFDGNQVIVQKTFTTGDIFCFKDINCVSGYGAGHLSFMEEPEAGNASILSNYHYTLSQSDKTEGFAGFVTGSYIKQYDEEEDDPDTVMTEQFNVYGDVVVLAAGENGSVRSTMNVARANFRNAMGSVAASEGFDPETYTFYDEELQATLTNGVLEGEYMTTSAFADALNNVPGLLMIGSEDWRFDEDHSTPYLYYESGSSGSDVNPIVRVVFELGCLNDGNCLTRDELASLEAFDEYRVGTNEFEFIVGPEGDIENTEWLEFAYNLTLENSDRPSVYWYTDDGLPFGKDNVYTSGVFYRLEVGTAPEQDEPGKTEPVEDDSDLPAVLTVLQSGKAVRLHARAGKVDDGETVQIEAELLAVDENGDDYVVEHTSFDVEKKGYHEEENWDVFPLASGMYLMSVTVTSGDERYVVEYDFEVDAQIAVGSPTTWRMLSLASVDMREVKWDGTGKFYWWDEFNPVGMYWQYQELSRKDTPEEGRGYWYNSLFSRPLQLKDSAFVDEVEWKLDSVNSGWNMVANPYGWYVSLGVDVMDTSRAVKLLMEEMNNMEKDDPEWFEEELKMMLTPSVEFWRWNEKKGEYEQADTLRPYEAVWAKVNDASIDSWTLSSSPVFVDTVNQDGNPVRLEPLNKAVVKSVSRKSGWTLQVMLSDANGKMDSWNTLGAALRASASEEPPAGMGDRVNLSILDGGKRLAKSVKAAGEGDAYEWNVELSATSGRKGFLEIAGVDALLGRGLHVFVTVDGKTREVHSGEKLEVSLSSTAKTASIRVAPTAKRSIASELRGLRAVQSGNALQVSFDASGLGGAKARIDVFDAKGSAVASTSQRCVDGINAFSLEIPHRGLYTVRVAAAGQAAMQRVLLR